MEKSSKRWRAGPILVFLRTKTLSIWDALPLLLPTGLTQRHPLTPHLTIPFLGPWSHQVLPEDGASTPPIRLGQSLPVGPKAISPSLNNFLSAFPTPLTDEECSEWWSSSPPALGASIRAGEDKEPDFLFPKLRMETHQSLTRAGMSDFCGYSQMGQEIAQRAGMGRSVP